MLKCGYQANRIVNTSYTVSQQDHSAEPQQGERQEPAQAGTEQYDSCQLWEPPALWLLGLKCRGEVICESWDLAAPSAVTRRLLHPPAASDRDSKEEQAAPWRQHWEELAFNPPPVPPQPGCLSLRGGGGVLQGAWGHHRNFFNPALPASPLLRPSQWDSWYFHRRSHF